MPVGWRKIDFTEQKGETVGKSNENYSFDLFLIK